MSSITPLSPIYIDSRSGSGPVSRKSKDKKYTRYRGLLEYSPLNLCADCKSTCHFIGGSDPYDYANGTWSCPSSSSHSPICQLTHLDSADVFFLGNGLDGVKSIGVELKSITELLSSLQSGRFINDQLPKMLDTYDVRWLLYYGEYRPNPSTGVLQLPSFNRQWVDYQPGSQSRPLPYGYLESRLLTFSHYGIQSKSVPTIQSAAYWIASLYRWWSKDREEDRKHLQVESKFSTSGTISTATLNPNPDLRKRLGFALSLPGLSHERGLAAANHFASIAAMVGASESEWTSIPGIGKVTARAIRRYVGAG